LIRFYVTGSIEATRICVREYPNDHPPAHIHVKRAEKLARVKLNPVEIWDYFKFNERELSEILEIVEANQNLLLVEWERFHTRS
jgi:hypothetical protein